MFLFSLLILLALDFTLYRVGSWQSRMAAKHRAMWSDKGYVENNTPYRKRIHRYLRIGMLSCLAVQLPVLIIMTIIIGKFGPPIVPILMAIIVGGFVGFWTTVGYGAFNECRHPIGALSVEWVRDRTMHRVIKPLPVSGRQHGEGRVVDPQDVGLIDPDAPRHRHTIVSPELETWAVSWMKTHGSAHLQMAQDAGLMESLRRQAKLLLDRLGEERGK